MFSRSVTVVMTLFSTMALIAKNHNSTSQLVKYSIYRMAQYIVGQDDVTNGVFFYFKKGLLNEFFSF